MRNIENLDRDSVFVQGEGNYARLILTELDQMLNYSMWLEHCSFRMFSSKISIEISLLKYPAQPLQSLQPWHLAKFL